MDTLTSSAVAVRTEFRAESDVAAVIALHDTVYRREFAFGGDAFTHYVREGLREFVAQYDKTKDCVWLCEINGELVGSLFLMNRGQAAQLRYFLLRSDVRGLGLGKQLMHLFMRALREKGYDSAYLWTVKGLSEATRLYKQHGFQLTQENHTATFGVPLTEQRYDLILPVIRPATLSDAPGLRDLMEKTFIDTYSAFNTPENMQMHIASRFGLAQLQHELLEKNVQYFTMTKGEQLIGFAKLVRDHHAKGLEGQNTVEIERIYVDQTHQGQQLGTRLIQACLNYAKEAAATVVWLGVWEHNLKAIQFYEKMGFERFGEHVFTLGTEVQNDFLMKKEL